MQLLKLEHKHHPKDGSLNFERDESFDKKDFEIPGVNCGRKKHGM